jgi:hypothetical protein
MMPNQAQPAATPAPIHDIADAVWFFPYPVWMLVLAALVLAGLVALAIWLVRRFRRPRPLTAREKALAALADLRRLGPEADPYAFGIQVSDALRTYIRDQHGLDAVTRTSLEFLETLRGNAVFNDNEKAALSEFLESVDLLKYARLSAGAEEIAELLSIAERVVRGEQPQTVPAP